MLKVLVTEPDCFCQCTYFLAQCEIMWNATKIFGLAEQGGFNTITIN